LSGATVEIDVDCEGRRGFSEKFCKLVEGMYVLPGSEFEYAPGKETSSAAVGSREPPPVISI
jgi:hypothetical protein